jgi:phosphate/sulfate permease
MLDMGEGEGVDKMKKKSLWAWDLTSSIVIWLFAVCFLTILFAYMIIKAMGLIK